MTEEKSDSVINVDVLQYHWYFYSKKSYSETWEPFTKYDSENLEKSFKDGGRNILSTNGGRYDVDIKKRIRYPIYWKEENSKVQRCSWFYRLDTDISHTPYSEDVSQILEELYIDVCKSESWNKKIEMADGSNIIMRTPTFILHFTPRSKNSLNFSFNLNECETRYVKRLVSPVLNFVDDESLKIDHLLMFVHGIGSSCDVKFRSMIECVDDFRSISQTMMTTHLNVEGRIEYLPILWHHSIHDKATGLDKKLESITLPSIGKLRQYTNDTLLDILLYGSPIYAQKILETVVEQMNDQFAIFKLRNPTFCGSISVAGHSLGSLILFDILRNQKYDLSFSEVLEYNLSIKKDNNIASSKGTFDINLPFVKYPQLTFHPNCFFALGSPISMFLTVRGEDSLGYEFQFPTCKRFFNIFHPYDPVAYRFEPLIIEIFPEKPLVIPHHKGRKRLHLELRDNLTRVGSDLKEKLWSSVMSTWQTISDSSLVSRVTRSKRISNNFPNASNNAITTENNTTNVSISNNYLNDEFISETNSIADSKDMEEYIPTTNVYPEQAEYIKESPMDDNSEDKKTTLCMFPDPTIIVDKMIDRNLNIPVLDGRAVESKTSNHCSNDANNFIINSLESCSTNHLSTSEEIFPISIDININNTLANEYSSLKNASSNSNNINESNDMLKMSNDAYNCEMDDFVEIGINDVIEDVSLHYNKFEEKNGNYVIKEDEVKNILNCKETIGNVATAEYHDTGFHSIGKFGSLNRGLRVDYVLQEAPIESINEYIFALSSHGCYWESQDTVLMVVKEIYNSPSNYL